MDQRGKEVKIASKILTINEYTVVRTVGWGEASGSPNCLFHLQSIIYVYGLDYVGTRVFTLHAFKHHFLIEQGN